MTRKAEEKDLKSAAALAALLWPEHAPEALLSEFRELTAEGEGALFLAGEGREVTVVQRSVLAKDANPRHRPELLRRLEGSVRLRTGYTALAVTEEGLLCRTPEGAEELLEADTVICAAGQRPLREEALALRDCAREFYAIGDCVSPRNILAATQEAEQLMIDIGRG